MSGWHHQVHFCRDLPIAKNKLIDWSAMPLGRHFFGGCIHDRLRGTHRRAHGLFTDRTPVVTHVAFNHLVECGVILRNPKWARKYAVRTANTAGLERGVNHPIRRSFDCIRRTHRRTGRFIAVHTDHWCCLNGIASLNSLQMDHRNPGMGIALCARFHACVTPNTATRVDIELAFTHCSPRTSCLEFCGILLERFMILIILGQSFCPPKAL